MAHASVDQSAESIRVTCLPNGDLYCNNTLLRPPAPDNPQLQPHRGPNPSQIPPSQPILHTSTNPMTPNSMTPNPMTANPMTTNPITGQPLTTTDGPSLPTPQFPPPAPLPAPPPDIHSSQPVSHLPLVKHAFPLPPIPNSSVPDHANSQGYSQGSHQGQATPAITAGMMDQFAHITPPVPNLPNQSQPPSQTPAIVAGMMDQFAHIKPPPPPGPNNTGQGQSYYQPQAKAPPAPAADPKQFRPPTNPWQPPSNSNRHEQQAATNSSTNPNIPTLHTPPLPKHFKSDQSYYDTNLVNARNGEQSFYLRKTVKRSASSNKMGITDIPIHNVPVVNVLYDQWQDPYLRNLSEGLPVHAILVSSAAEAVLYKKLRTIVWDMDIEIHELMDHIWADKKENDPDTKIPSKMTQLYQHVTPLAQAMANGALEMYKKINRPESEKVAELQSKLDAMAKQLEQAKNSKSSSSSPTKPAPTMPPISPCQKVKDEPEAKRRKIDLQSTTALNPKQLNHSRPLETSAPRTGQKSDVDRWLKNIKKNIDAVEAARLDQYIESVEKAYSDIKPNSDRPNLKDIAAQWGLPVDSMMQHYGPTSLLRVSACAAYTTAILSA